MGMIGAINDRKHAYQKRFSNLMRLELRETFGSSDNFLSTCSLSRRGDFI